MLVLSLFKCGLLQRLIWCVVCLCNISTSCLWHNPPVIFSLIINASSILLQMWLIKKVYMMCKVFLYYFRFASLTKLTVILISAWKMPCITIFKCSLPIIVLPHVSDIICCNIHFVFLFLPLTLLPNQTAYIFSCHGNLCLNIVSGIWLCICYSFITIFSNLYPIQCGTKGR